MYKGQRIRYYIVCNNKKQVLDREGFWTGDIRHAKLYLSKAKAKEMVKMLTILATYQISVGMVELVVHGVYFNEWTNNEGP